MTVARRYSIVCESASDVARLLSVSRSNVCESVGQEGGYVGGHWVEPTPRVPPVMRSEEELAREAIAATRPSVIRKLADAIGRMEDR